MIKSEKYILGAIAGTIVSLYSIFAIVVSTIDKDVHYAFSNPFYMLGFVGSLGVSALAGIFWIYLNDDGEKGLSRMKVFQLGLVGPIVLASLLRGAGGEKLPDLPKAGVGPLDLACELRRGPLNENPVGSPERRPRSANSLEEFEQFGPVSTEGSYQLEPQPIVSLVNGLFLSNMATLSSQKYEARYLRQKPSPDKFDAATAYFLIAGSHLDIKEAESQVRWILDRAPNLAVSIYPPYRGNPYHAVVTASWVRKDIVDEATEIAKRCGLFEADAFAWQYPAI